ncbi:MAG: hypothetical protein MZV65_20330 [Chromatiales bacterium]|nr:hypothetical protein [Chromatiales bacterium]
MDRDQPLGRASQAAYDLLIAAARRCSRRQRRGGARGRLRARRDRRVRQGRRRSCRAGRAGDDRATATPSCS